MVGIGDHDGARWPAGISATLATRAGACGEYGSVEAQVIPRSTHRENPESQSGMMTGVLGYPVKPSANATSPNRLNHRFARIVI